MGIKYLCLFGYSRQCFVYSLKHCEQNTKYALALTKTFLALHWRWQQIKMLSCLAWFEVTLVVYFWKQHFLIYVKLICYLFVIDLCSEDQHCGMAVGSPFTQEHLPLETLSYSRNNKSSDNRGQEQEKEKAGRGAVLFHILGTSNKLWSWNRKPICAFILHPINLHRLVPSKAKIYFKQYLSE